MVLALYCLCETDVLKASPLVIDICLTPIGPVFTGSYTYMDNEGDAEADFTYKWYGADDTSGTNKTEIVGVTALIYI